MIYIIAGIGWALAAIAIVGFVKKAADRTCPECRGEYTVMTKDHRRVITCPTCNGEGKL